MDMYTKDENGQWWFFKDVNSPLLQIYSGTDKIPKGYEDNQFTPVDPAFPYVHGSDGQIVQGKKAKLAG